MLSVLWYRLLLGLQQSVSNLITRLLTYYVCFSCLFSLSSPSMSEVGQGDNPTHYVCNVWKQLERCMVVPCRDGLCSPKDGLL